MSNNTHGATAADLSGIRIAQLQQELAVMTAERDLLRDYIVKRFSAIRAWATEANLTAVQRLELREILEEK